MNIKLNRWVYMVLVVLAAVAAGVAVEFGTLAGMCAGLLLLMLTLPAGVLGLLCAVPLIYSGMATPSEAYFIAAPLFALAGMLQWYVLLPKLYRRHERFSASAKPPRERTH